MKTSCKDLGKCQVQLTVELDAEEAKAAVKAVEKVFAREAQIPGFRKGKVPIELIRKEFASGLKEETERELLRKYYADAVKAESLDAVKALGGSEITDASGITTATLGKGSTSSNTLVGYEALTEGLYRQSGAAESHPCRFFYA